MSHHHHHTRRVVRNDDFDIELDGYETGRSSEDFDDDYDDGYPTHDADMERDNDDLVGNINIRGVDSPGSAEDLPDVPDTEDPFKNTELVIKFNPKIETKALRWFILRIIESKSRGGPELMLKREPVANRNDGLVVHVTASSWRLLEVAEKLEIHKRDYITDAIRPFQLNEVNHFLNDDMDISEVLSPAEKQMVVAHELHNLSARPGERHVPGYKHLRLSTGQSLFHVLTKKRLIVSSFALHQEEELSKLKNKCFLEFWDEWPYEDIRNYFGDATCLYFNFIAYYTYWLVFPGVIGIVIFLLSFILPDSWSQNLAVYSCAVNMLFVTMFLIWWHRYQSKITFQWGTLQGLSNVWEQPRENYVGHLSVDPVTGGMFKRYPYYKVVMKTYLVSLPIELVCCAIAIWLMFKYLEWEIYAKDMGSEKLKEKGLGPVKVLWWKYGFPNIPVAVYCTTVVIFTKVYRLFADFLTEWENHRTETQFERHLVHKMVLFEVANGFSVLLYTAFVLNDIELLKFRLGVQIGITHCILLVVQCIIPYVINRGQVKMLEFLDDNHFSSVFLLTGTQNVDTSNPYPGLEGLKIGVMDELDYRVQMSKVEELMYPYHYEEDFDEYLNAYLQFGYIFMFSSVFPVAATLAIGVNLALLYSGLLKRRLVYQRSLARRVSSIGAWGLAFEMLTVFSVITNCTLLAMNKTLREQFPSYSDAQWIVICVGAEHIILGAQHFLRKIWPRIPYAVKISLARFEFMSRQAYKRERANKRQERRIGQYFAPINRKLHHQTLQGTDTEETITQMKPSQVHNAKTVHWNHLGSKDSVINTKLRKKHH